ncbi:hypothetical protein [Cohnella cellulosilytica]|uniref:Butirosin biosynthesis protein H N-terminal domain-containing protein n=1 Tax=Cohnella cellulosilytica TaxID=986710 RepID=A0ABW2FBY0_9BACL
MIAPVPSGASASSSIVALGAMTCTESCVSTLLGMLGCDYGAFFMNYWNLYYENGTLLAGRNMKGIDLEALYGIRSEWLADAPLEACADLVREDGRYALLVTRASKLPYFPPQLLRFEDEGFDHYVLAHGYREADGRFLIVDPIAGYAGELAGERLLEAAPSGGGFRLWSLQRTEGFRAPATKEAFALASKQNYVRNLRNREIFSLVLQELERFVPAPSKRQLDWVARNNIAITTIVRNRRLIWQSLSAANVLPAERSAPLEAAFSGLVAQWTQLNLQLFKWSKARFSPGLPDAIRSRLEALRLAESAILEALYREGEAIG